MLIYKEVCRDLPECEARYYQPQRNSFDPFPADANSYTPWSARGLESGKKEIKSFIRVSLAYLIRLINDLYGLRGEKDTERQRQSYFYETNGKYTEVPPNYPSNNAYINNQQADTSTDEWNNNQNDQVWHATGNTNIEAD